MTSLKARWQNRYIIENMPPSLHAGEEEAEANQRVLTMGLGALEKERLARGTSCVPTPCGYIYMLTSLPTALGVSTTPI